MNKSGSRGLSRIAFSTGAMASAARPMAIKARLESRARTIEQMRLINALCRFAEMAEGQE
jgi:hypothetical protein